MTYTVEYQQGANFLNALIEKTWSDDNFKTRLIKDPVTTVSELTGKSFVMPDNKKLLIEDQSDESIIYLNIPHKPTLEELELSDEQLEEVAGGEFFATAGAVLAVVGACAAVYSVGRGIYDGVNAQ